MERNIEELKKEGEEIARKLGNGVTYIGPQIEDGEFRFYWFNDSLIMTDATFTAKTLERAREKLTNCRISFGKPLPDFQQLAPPKTSKL